MAFMVVLSVICYWVNAQDAIYTLTGKVIKVKVTEVGPKQIKYTATDNPGGPVYIMNEADIDSIVYANGKVDQMPLLIVRRNLRENIPQLNTWTLDLVGFAFASVSQSYECRLKNGKVGFRVPLYIGYFGGNFAGLGTFKPGIGVYSARYYDDRNYYNRSASGSSMATGLNVKCYLFKRRIIRLFAGPEATMGYTLVKTGSYTTLNGMEYNKSQTYGTVALLGNVGLNLNPIDKFHVSIDGGAGIGDMFGHTNVIGVTGLWHVGFALGTNF